MMAQTHLVIGTAVSLYYLQPNTLSEWILCTGSAVIGSVICDIDSCNSRSRKKLNQITALCTAVILFFFFCEFRWHPGLWRTFERESSSFRMISGFLIFLIVCNYGKNQPHRSFMHSIPGCFLLSAIVVFIHPYMGKAFALAMASHIAIDLLNRRRVRLFYPLDRGLCFYFCEADGIICRILFGFGALATVFLTSVLFLTRYLWEFI